MHIVFSKVDDRNVPVFEDRIISFQPNIPEHNQDGVEFDDPLSVLLVNIAKLRAKRCDTMMLHFPR